ncbi:hypothetical protein DKX38_027507 [Salix brachista]|uniref:SIAH-type domain-containing protein n=1 Tax=Salix brachista TaxID=2182728 RepID=A0A5N5JC58_9ROSI|nr:hypothetical protein DKX38_027507 [Salix brachista]
MADSTEPEPQQTEFSKYARAIRERALKQADDALKGIKTSSGDEKLCKGIHGYIDLWWQMEKEWEEAEKARKRQMGHGNEGNETEADIDYEARSPDQLEAGSQTRTAQMRNLLFCCISPLSKNLVKEELAENLKKIFNKLERLEGKAHTIHLIKRVGGKRSYDPRSRCLPTTSRLGGARVHGRHDANQAIMDLLLSYDAKMKGLEVLDQVGMVIVAPGDALCYSGKMLWVVVCDGLVDLNGWVKIHCLGALVILERWQNSHLKMEKGQAFQPKRQRPSSLSPPDFTMEEIVREDEESDEDEEDDDVDTSDGSEEEDEDEEEEEPVEETVRSQPPPPPQQQQQDQPPPRPHENNQITTVRLQPPQHRLFEASKESDEDEEDDDVDTSDGSEEEDEDEEEEEPVEETVRSQPPPPPQQQQQDQPPPRPHENNQITTVRLQPPQHRLFEASNFLGHNLVGPSRNGAIHATLSDPEVLDCPICCEPLTIPVFQVANKTDTLDFYEEEVVVRSCKKSQYVLDQVGMVIVAPGDALCYSGKMLWFVVRDGLVVLYCENGHTACSSCCRKLQHKCPSCAMPIGYNRCRAIEKVLESLKIRCSNRSYGCKESICYSKKYEHDRSCSHAPCTCPLPACNFQGSSRYLYLHCRSKHLCDLISFRFSTTFPLSFRVDHKFRVLQEDKEGVLFILNNRLECLGNIITISCMGPSSSKLGYFYELTAKAEGSNVRFQSSTRNIQTRVDHPPSMGFLLVPNDFIGTRGGFTLDVCIWRLGSNPAVSSALGSSIQCK